MIRGCVVAGLRRAKASGNHVRRPRAVRNRLRVAKLRNKGLSWRAIARRMDLLKSTVHGRQRRSHTPSAKAPY